MLFVLRYQKSKKNTSQPKIKGLLFKINEHLFQQVVLNKVPYNNLQCL